MSRARNSRLKQTSSDVSRRGAALEDISLASRPVRGVQLREQIELLSRCTPQFLFRGWGSDSGGDGRLNTEKAIRLRAFLWGPGPRSLHDISRIRLVDLTICHLGNKEVNTVFSSWSQSLYQAIGFARRRIGAYISIVDTKELSAQQLVLYVPRMGMISQDITPMYQGEFLAFGTVPGAAYKSVRIEMIECLVPDADDSPKKMSLDARIEKSLRAGKLFGGRFALQVVAHLIALGPSNYTNKEMLTIVNQLCTLKMSRDIFRDMSIMVPGIYHDKYHESLRAENILNIVADKIFSRGLFLQIPARIIVGVEERMMAAMSVIEKRRKSGIYSACAVSEALRQLEAEKHGRLCALTGPPSARQCILDLTRPRLY